MAMSEDEYWDSDPEFNDDSDDEILGDFLIEEVDDDLTLVMLPKLDFNLEDDLDRYYKAIKQCRNKDQIKHVLRQFYAYTAGVTAIQIDIERLQTDAQELEFNIQMLSRSQL